MAVSALDRRKLDGTGASGEHADELLDKVEALITLANSSETDLATAEGDITTLQADVTALENPGLANKSSWTVTDDASPGVAGVALYVYTDVFGTSRFVGNLAGAANVLAAGTSGDAGAALDAVGVEHNADPPGNLGAGAVYFDPATGTLNADTNYGIDVYIKTHSGRIVTVSANGGTPVGDAVYVDDNGGPGGAAGFLADLSGAGDDAFESSILRADQARVTP